MKELFTFFLLGVGFSLFGQNSDSIAIASVIQSAYVEGLQNEGDSTKIDAGFHHQFQMIRRGENDDLILYPIGDWKARAIEAREKGFLPRPQEKKVSLEFIFIDVTKDAAVAKVKYIEGQEHTYTDYITLYKFGADWKIVSKAFHTIK
ncbi:MAG: nuclear transport factor 2 family protein [Bacteroidia bacterium]